MKGCPAKCPAWIPPRSWTGTPSSRPDVVVGPYAIVEAGVILGPGCVLHAHAAIVKGAAVLGAGNVVVHPFAVIGGVPQAKRHTGGPGRLEIRRRERLPAST